MSNIGRFCASTIWMRSPSGRDVEQQLILERLERLALVDGLLQVLHQRFELLALVAPPTVGLGLRRLSSALCVPLEAVLRRSGGVTGVPMPGLMLCVVRGASRPPPRSIGLVLAPPGPICPGAGFTLLPGSMLGFLK